MVKNYLTKGLHLLRPGLAAVGSAFRGGYRPQRLLCVTHIAVLSSSDGVAYAPQKTARQAPIRTFHTENCWVAARAKPRVACLTTPGAVTTLAAVLILLPGELHR
jgi:hypothetical protein